MCGMWFTAKCMPEFIIEVWTEFGVEFGVEFGTEFLNEFCRELGERYERENHKTFCEQTIRRKKW